jgi:glucosamine--fructose-6-phosphate aminotransferase (isomerizing)
LLSRTDKVIVIAQQEWTDVYNEPPAIILPSTWSDKALGPLAIIPLQILAWKWTIMVGKDPDHPANITQVVQLDDSERGNTPS